MTQEERMALAELENGVSETRNLFGGKGQREGGQTPSLRRPRTAGKMAKSFRICSVMALGAVCLAGCFDKTPRDVKLLQEGSTLEMQSEHDKARAKYAEAASLGNADAFKRLGDLTISKEYVLLSPENATDYANGYDTWLIQAKQALAKAEDFYDKAKMAGCTNQLDASMAKLKTLTAKVSETEAKVREAKEQKRQEELRRQEEERQAELRRQEELRRKQEEEKRLAEEAARRAALAAAGLGVGAVRRISCGLDRTGGVAVYEVAFTHDGSEYAYAVDARTGAVRGGKKTSGD